LNEAKNGVPLSLGHNHKPAQVRSALFRSPHHSFFDKQTC